MADSLKVSWSQLRLSSECKQRAYLVREGKKSSTANQRMFILGNVCDRIMRKWLLDPVPGAMPDMVDQQIDDSVQEALDDKDGVVRWRDKEDKGKVKDKCRKALTNLEPVLLDLVILHSFEVAKRFKVPLILPYNGEMREVLLTGEMDLLIQDDNAESYQVFDLKITEDASYWKKTLGQLIFYDLVVQIMHKGAYCSRTGLMQPLCKEPVLYFNFTKDQYRQMLASIHNYAVDVWSMSIDPKEDTKGCNWCFVKHACVRYVGPGARFGVFR